MAKRKFRDLACAIIFIAFWILVIAMAIYCCNQPALEGQKASSRVWLLMRPGDKLRRMCGYTREEQPDFLATDYSSNVMSEGQLKTFCWSMQQVFKNDSELKNIDCGNLTSASTVRPFTKLVSAHYNDMSGYTHGVRTQGQTVCTTLTNCDEVPAKATYVCHREFVDIARVVLGESAAPTSQFIDDTMFYKVVSAATVQSVDFSFLKTLCVAMPTYKGNRTDYREDYQHIPTVYNAPVSSKMCEQSMASAVSNAFADVRSSPAAEYLADFFENMGQSALVELRTQYWTVIVACVLSLPLAYLVLFLMKIMVGVLVWAIIIVVVVGGALLGAWLIYMGCAVERENEYR